MTKTVSDYKDKNFIRFVSDCQRRGLKVEHMEGIPDPRPFVNCANPFDVKEATDLKIQWLRKNSRYIVFPAKSKAGAVKFNPTL
jgi:hypothetical protein